MKSLFVRLFTGLAVVTLGLSPAEAAPKPTPTPAPAKKSSTGSKSASRSSKSSKKSAPSPTPKRRTGTTPSRPTPPKQDPVIIPRLEGGIPQMEAASIVVMNADTGRILYQKNAFERRPPASTQKLLTALIVAEEGNLDKPVRIQESDTWAEPVMLYIKPGQVYTRRQLLEALMVKSFNDVARALARDNAGSVEAFAAKMNAKARQLGMTQSYFVNPNGLTEPGQLSTAYDMAKLARAVYFNPTLREIVKIKELHFRYPNGKVTTFKNTNRVLRGWAPCNGMKTGYTMAAGHCLVSSAQLNGKNVIVVVLGSNRREIWQGSASLLAWGLRHS